MAVNNLNTGVGIQPTIVDAKGDLIAATANDAVNRLAVGTNGQVLVADSGETTGLKWNNPGTVGGLVHINTTSFSAVASQSINDVFSATYDNYLINLHGINASMAIGLLNLRLRVSGADNSTSVYGSVDTFFGSGTGSTNTITGTSFPIASIGSEARSPLMLEIGNPFIAENTTYASRSYAVRIGIDTYQNIFSGAFRNTTSFTGFTIFPASGTITGTVRVYGFKN
jgi:hypothetical protein